MRTLFAALVALLASSPAFAQFSNLTVTPTHPTAGLRLNWTGPGGTINVNRWTDANPTPAVIGTITGATYTDSTPAVNTIYYYSVSQGAAVSNTFMGVVSDISQPFNCPPMVPISPSLLGVDRTETFTAADGTTVTFTIQAPIPATPPPRSFRCRHAPVLPAAAISTTSTMRSIQQSQTAAAPSNFQPAIITLIARSHARRFLVVWSSATFNYNIFLDSFTPGLVHDVILAGANVASGAEPTTHVFFNQTPALVGSVDGLVTGGNRVLTRNITFDWDFPTAIPACSQRSRRPHAWRCSACPTASFSPSPMVPITCRTRPPAANLRHGCVQFHHPDL